MRIQGKGLRHIADVAPAGINPGCLAAAQQNDPGTTLDQIVGRARQAHPDKLIEIECDTIEMVRAALSGSPDWILLDNMTPSELAACVASVAGSIKLEASGGVTLESVRVVAETGIDAISVGALTHSVSSIDIGLDFLEQM